MHITGRRNLFHNQIQQCHCTQNKQGCSRLPHHCPTSLIQLTNNCVLGTGSSLWQGFCPFRCNYLWLSLRDISSRPLDLCFTLVLLLKKNKWSHKATEQWMWARLLDCEIIQTTGTSHIAVNTWETVCLSDRVSMKWSSRIKCGHSNRQDEGNWTVTSSTIFILRH